MPPSTSSIAKCRGRVARPFGVVLLGTLVACSTPAEKPPAGAVAQTAADSAPAEAAVQKPACPLEGDWTPCAVEDRLVHAGVVIEKQPEPTRHPFFAVEGAVYRVGGPDHELQVFLYPSAAARERDTAALDSATVSPKGTRVIWKTPPTLVTSNNLAAVILSLNDRTVERLALALAAGLPVSGKR